MDDGTIHDDGKDKNTGKIIAFPNGKQVSTDEIGVAYVVGGSGHVPTPDIQDPALVAKELIDRNNYVRNQPLVQQFDRGATTSEIIDTVLKEIAEEAAHLKWDRRQAAKEGRPTTNYNVARIGSLRNLTDLLLKRKEADIAERLDLKSPRFQKIFQVIMEFFHECMAKSGVDQEVIDIVFQQMKADMIDWESKFSE